MPNLSGNIILLTFLYFIQGLPYGFQAQFLPVYLRSKGVDLTHVGFMKLLHMPWLCKALWAPMVDKLGTKRKWLIGSVLGLIITCLYGGFIPPDNLVLLCSVLLLLNVFASTQDIAVDSIAVAILSQKELGHGNTAQVVGYKIGSIFGGGLLVWFMNFLGWTGLFLVMALLYLEALLFVFVSPVLRNFENSQLYDDRSDSDDSEVFDANYDSDAVSKGECEISDYSESLPDLIELPNILQDNVDRLPESKPDVLPDPNDRADRTGVVTTPNDENRCQHEENTSQASDFENVANDKSDICDSVPNSNEDDVVPRLSPINLFCDGNLLVDGGVRERILDRDMDYIESESDDDSRSYCGPELSQEDIDNLQSAAEYVHYESESHLAIDISTAPKKLIDDVMSTPGTKWMILYVLFYKLGEQGSLGMLPLFLVDHKVDVADVTFWTALVGQGISIVGSIMGGFIVSKYGVPVYLFLQQLSLLRLTPLGIQVLLVGAWTYDIYVFDELIYTYIAIGSMFVLLLISGIVTTVTFTFMMQCSKMAPTSVQATHYSTLATCEVFGKLAFTAVTGWLADVMGYPFLFLLFVVLAAVVMLLFKTCPDELNDDDELDVPVSKEKVD